ncbi:MAG TPA: hypothetical protein VGN72_06370 [Tepidisphaeraceae bacterium]|nr:hypothetical protein [Tepidisphaeraceae bacterium]
MLALLVIVSLTSVKAWQNVKVAQLPALHRKASNDAAKASSDMLDNFARGERGRMSLTEVQRVFPQYVFKIRPPVAIESKDGQTFMKEEGFVEDPRSGAIISVSFLDGRVSGYGTLQFVRNWPAPPAHFDLVEDVRQRTMYTAATLWFAGVFLAAVFWHRLRPIPSVSGLLIIAIVWSAAGLLTPDAFVNWSHFWMRLEFWIWAVAATVVTLFWLRHLLRKPRDFTRCLQCNYDLTGNLSGICPECGTAVPPAPPDALTVELAALDAAAKRHMIESSPAPKLTSPTPDFH